MKKRKNNNCLFFLFMSSMIAQAILTFLLFFKEKTIEVKQNNMERFN